MFIIKAVKRGRFLALTLPPEVVEGMKIKEGSYFQVKILDRQIILAPTEVPDLKTLLRKAKIQNRPKINDLPDVGNEMVE